MLYKIEIEKFPFRCINGGDVEISMRRKLNRLTDGSDSEFWRGKNLEYFFT